jgi:(p)ppGpp synthase/HD superfamily hydrolase
MLLNPKIQKAIYIATNQHRNQERKTSDLPYIVHPFSVAWILAEQTKDEDVVVAGLLHDVLEDTVGYSYNDIVRDFGERTAKIVNEVTEIKDLPWQERKEKYIEVFENSSQESLMVATADKIHNLASLHESFLETGINQFGVNFRPLKESKWFYDTVYEVMERRLENRILLVEFKEMMELVFGKN